MYSDLFKEGRKWQNEYLGYKDGKAKNLLMPCFIRDHYDTFRKVVKKTNPKPEDINAKKVLNDKKYYNKLIKFDKELKKLTEEIWKKEF
jgi:hypothetical protein